MKIVCISGKAGCGKDTFAQALAKELRAKGFKVFITHYADLVKFICTNYFGWDGEKDIQGRHLLQYVGTDVVRESNPDYWVNFIISMLRFFPDIADFVIIPDARFVNEIERLKEEEFDAISVRIEREFKSVLSNEQLAHISETELDNYEFDVVLDNTAYGAFKKNIRKVFNILTENKEEQV